MNIRKKTLLILGLSLAGLVVFACLIFANMLLDGFKKLEQEHMASHLAAVRRGISASLSDLNGIAWGTGSWDGAYEFALSEDPDFARDNLDDTMFPELELNLVVMVNTSGKVLHARGFDLAKRRDMPPEPALLEALASRDSPLMVGISTGADTSAACSGILLTSRGPMLVAARPILTTRGEGPARGMVILGRYFDRDAIEGLFASAVATVEVKPANTRDLPSFPNPNLSGATRVADPPIQVIAERDVLRGYLPLTDIFGHPSMVLEVSTDRSIYREGKATTTRLLLVFFLLALVFDLAVLVLSERWVLSRLVNLSRQLQRVESTGNIDGRVVATGNDEVASVAEAVNGLLASLCESRGRLLDAQRKLEDRVRERTAELAGANHALKIENAERKKAEQALQKAHDHLELQVARRTEKLVGINVHLSRLVAERRRAEAALRDSERRFKQLFDSMLAAFAVCEIITDEDGNPVDYRLLDANPAFDVVTGFKREEVIGKTIKQVVPGFEDFWIERFGEVAVAQFPIHFDAYSEAFGKHFEVTAFSPAERQFAVTFSDVSERKGAEEEREATLELLGLLNSASDQVQPLSALASFLRGWMRCDAVGVRLKEGNEFPCVESLGYPSGFIRRERGARVFSPGGDREEALPFRCVCGRLLAGGITHAGEGFTEYGSFMTGDTGCPVAGLSVEARNACPLSACQAGGSMLVVPLNAGGEVLGLLQFNSFSPGGFETGKIESVERFAINIALSLARSRAEEQRRLLTSAIEQAAEAILITDTDGAIQYVNPAFERITGYGREEVLGENPRILNSGKHDEHFFWNMWQTLGSGQVWMGRLVNRRKDGSLFEEEATISPVRDASGRIVRFVAVKRDVTQELELEQRLRRAQKMESLGTLAGGIAHDFNNILAAIIGYTELSRYNAMNPDRVASNLDQVLKAANRARDLVQQILAFSRQQEGEKRSVEMNHLVKEVLKLIRASVPATVEIRWSIPESPIYTVADAIQIHQVLMNLCTNAAHAMRRRGGLLAVSLDRVQRDASNADAYPELTEGVYARLVVQDTGHGMDAATLERIFDPYFTTKDKGVGTGLGLAVVHGIVKSHGGTVLVKSSVGEGTEFQVFLPFIDAAPGDAARSPLQPQRGTERILLVDDEPSLIQLGREILGSLGYAVTTVPDGQRAMQMVRNNGGDFDLVITDMTMPIMTGLDLAREIRALRPSLPVLLCTGHSDILTPEGAREAGIRQVIAKPFSIQELSTSIRRALTRSTRLVS